MKTYSTGPKRPNIRRCGHPHCGVCGTGRPVRIRSKSTARRAGKAAARAS